MHTITATEAVRDFATCLKNLPDTGPIAIERHGHTVGELHPPTTPESKAQAFTDALALVRRMDAWSGAHNEPPDSALAALGITGPAGWIEFLDALDHYRDAYGIELSYEDLFNGVIDLVTDGRTPPVSEIVARMYLWADADTIAAAGQDPVAWSRVVAEVTQYAREKGDITSPMTSYDYNDASVIPGALEAGFTDATFAVRARELVDSGVKLEDLSSALGPDALPADMLAADVYLEDNLTLLTRCGMEREDALVLLRRLLVQYGEPGSQGYRTAYTAKIGLAAEMARTGVTGSRQLLELLQRDYPLALVQRAHDEELTAEQWQPLLDAIGRKTDYDRDGLLPLAVLAEGARRGIALKRWDSPGVTQTTRSRIATYSRSLVTNGSEGRNVAAMPWVDIYPGRVLELAAEKITPGYVAEAYSYFTASSHGILSRPVEWRGPGAVVDDIKVLHAAGVPLELLKALNQRVKGVPHARLTVEEVRRAVRYGLSAPVVAYLRDQEVPGEHWLTELATWNRQQGLVDAFLEGQRGKADQWRAITALHEEAKNLRKEARTYRYSGTLALALEGARIAAEDSAEKITSAHLREMVTLVEWTVSRQYPGCRQYLALVDREAAARFVREVVELFQRLYLQAKDDAEAARAEAEAPAAP